jgi:sortase A
MQETDFKQNKILLGLSLVLIGLFLVFLKPTGTNYSPDYTFESEPVQIQGFQESDGDEARLPRKIVVPDLSIDLEVAKAKVVKGYWEVFPDKAGWGDGSGLPGEAGNQVIFAHAREGLFLPLRDIKKGMLIYVFTEKEWYEYEVEEIKEVYPDQTEVISPTEDETLTLYTCSGFNDSKRLIAVAKRANL